MSREIDLICRFRDIGLDGSKQDATITAAGSRHPDLAQDLGEEPEVPAPTGIAWWARL